MWGWSFTELRGVLCVHMAAWACVTMALATESSAFPAIALEPVVTGLEHPLYLAEPPDGSGRLFIVEQPGRIRIIEKGKLRDRPFLDITRWVRSTGAEQGLLGLAFHPDYGRNGRY